MEESHYTVYKTTNLLNNKCYIGAHKTTNPDDAYLGSGVVLKNAIKKHGRANFKKEILIDCSSSEEMFLKEALLVNESFVSSPDNYNLSVGGKGGAHFRGRHHSDETKAKLSKINKGKVISDEAKDKIKLGLQNVPKKVRADASRKGGLQSPSEETKKKISEALNIYYASDKYKEDKKNKKQYVRTKKTVYPIVTCPHCNKQGANNNMKRWHFDNCKNKTNE